MTFDGEIVSPPPSREEVEWNACCDIAERLLKEYARAVQNLSLDAASQKAHEDAALPIVRLLALALQEKQIAEATNTDVRAALQALVDLRNKDYGSWRGVWGEAWNKANAALRGEQ